VQLGAPQALEAVLEYKLIPCFAFRFCIPRLRIYLSKKIQVPSNRWNVLRHFRRPQADCIYRATDCRWKAGVESVSSPRLEIESKKLTCTLNSTETRTERRRSGADEARNSRPAANNYRSRGGGGLAWPHIYCERDGDLIGSARTGGFRQAGSLIRYPSRTSATRRRGNV